MMSKNYTYLEWYDIRTDVAVWVSSMTSQYKTLIQIILYVSTQFIFQFGCILHSDDNVFIKVRISFIVLIIL